MSLKSTIKSDSAPLSLAGDDARVSASVNAIRQLFAALPADQRQIVFLQLAKEISPIPTPRGGVVLSEMARILAGRVHWTVPDIKKAFEDSGSDALPKDIYNAVGYLARRGYIKRVGYGRYIVEGAELTTAEDIGEPSRNED